MYLLASIQSHRTFYHERNGHSRVMKKKPTPISQVPNRSRYDFGQRDASQHEMIMCCITSFLRTDMLWRDPGGNFLIKLRLLCYKTCQISAVVSPLRLD